jgi:hypothetical protein
MNFSQLIIFILLIPFFLINHLQSIAGTCGTITAGIENYPEPNNIGYQYCDINGPDFLAPGDTGEYIDSNGNSKYFTMPKDGCNCGTHIVRIGNFRKEIRSTSGYWKLVSRPTNCGCGGIGSVNVEVVSGGQKIISYTYRAYCPSPMNACGGATFPIEFPSPHGDYLCVNYSMYCGYDGFDHMYEWACYSETECNKPNQGPPQCQW